MALAAARLFAAIADAPSSLGALKRAARLYALCVDPLIGPIFDLDSSYTIPPRDLITFGADPASRAAHVDRELAVLLDDACADVDAASAKFAAMSTPMRTLLVLRFYALGSWDVCLAAENVQCGLETVLGDDCTDDRDYCVDEFGMAMDVLRDALPAEGTFQAALDALLAGNAMSADAFECMTDDGILPDLDWLFDVEDMGEE